MSPDSSTGLTINSLILRGINCARLIENLSQILQSPFWQLITHSFKPLRLSLKEPRLYYGIFLAFEGSGLSLFLQNVFTPQDLNTYAKLDKVFETFIVEEILRGLDASNFRSLHYFHFRAKAGGEIDLIIEGSFGLVPIEIKLQSNTTKRQNTSLLHFVDIHNLPFGAEVRID